MTFIGKALVFLNLFAAVALLTWAGSLMVNRVDWLDRKTDDGKTAPGQLTTLKDEIAARLAEIKDATGSLHKEYATQSKNLADVEARRRYRADRMEAFLEGARKGKFYEFKPDGPGPLLDVRENPVPPREVVKGLNSTDLRGETASKQDLDKEFAEAKFWADEVAKKRIKLAGISRDVDEIEVRVSAQTVIAANLRDEEKLLRSSQINWDEELRTLTRRQKQLERRLDPAGVKVGADLRP